MKNNMELVSYCENALKNKWYYGWGAWGQKATKALVENIISQYPSMNLKYRDYMLKAVQVNNNLCDCYGLVKGFLFSNDKGQMIYNAKYDVNSGMAFSRAKEKGTINTMPDVPGIILHMGGHVGVYMGGGRFVECRGGGIGMVAGRIENGKVVSGSKFVNWFKDISIEYVDNEIVEKITDNEEQTDKKVVFILDGKEHQIGGRLNKEGYNEVNMREICDVLGFDVEYDPVEKIAILSKK